jgi:hypothetical protein
MERLKLRLESLAVDTFDTREGAKDEARTAQAFAATQEWRCNTYFCTYGGCTGLPC